MKLSIITINYNDLTGLQKTTQSVFDQDSTEFEYIVIDGGSDDGSLEYLEEHTARITHFVSEPDKGIYNAMNKGIALAQGTYIYFLNSGDWLCDIQVISNLIPELGNCDALYGNMIKQYPNGLTRTDKGPQGSPINLNTFTHGTLNHGATFIASNLFDQYGRYDESLKIVSDWKFFLQTLGVRDSVVKYIDLNILNFDMTGVSNSNLELRSAERLDVLRNELSKEQFNTFIKERFKILRRGRYTKFVGRIRTVFKKWFKH